MPSLYTDSVYIPALGHDIVSRIVREVTCTEPGIVEYSCTRCNYSRRDYIYSEHIYTVTDHKAATCEADGYTEYTCGNCGDVYNFNYFVYHCGGECDSDKHCGDDAR